MSQEKDGAAGGGTKGVPGTRRRVPGMRIWQTVQRWRGRRPWSRWRTRGVSRADLEDGPVIPFVPGGAEVPQGLGHDPERDELVYTFYDVRDSRRGLLVIADAEGEVTARVGLTGLDHYGGVAVLGRWTYVSGAGRLQVHETECLRGGLSEPVATVRVRASSTVTAHDGGLWVARFVVDGPGRAHRYRITADGRPEPTGEELVVPPRTQGLAFDGDRAVWFSRSWGRTAPSVLTRVDAADLARDGGWTPATGRDWLLPPMAEGSVIVDGRLLQLYESAAGPYRQHRRGPRPVMNLLLGRLEPREYLTVHDLD